MLRRPETLRTITRTVCDVLTRHGYAPSLLHCTERVEVLMKHTVAPDFMACPDHFSYHIGTILCNLTRHEECRDAVVRKCGENVPNVRSHEFEAPYSVHPFDVNGEARITGMSLGVGVGLNYVGRRNSAPKRVRSFQVVPPLHDSLWRAIFKSSHFGCQWKDKP